MIADALGLAVPKIGEHPGREGCKLKHLLKPLAAPALLAAARPAAARLRPADSGGVAAEFERAVAHVPHSGFPPPIPQLATSSKRPIITRLFPSSASRVLRMGREGIR